MKHKICNLFDYHIVITNIKTAYYDNINDSDIQIQKVCSIIQRHYCIKLNGLQFYSMTHDY